MIFIKISYNFVIFLMNIIISNLQRIKLKYFKITYKLHN